MNSAVGTDHAKSQWVDLGIHTEACMTRPETCGTGAMSRWMKLIDCSALCGIISTRVLASSGPLIYWDSGVIGYNCLTFFTYHRSLV